MYRDKRQPSETTDNRNRLIGDTYILRLPDMHLKIAVHYV